MLSLIIRALSDEEFTPPALIGLRVVARQRTSGEGALSAEVLEWLPRSAQYAKGAGRWRDAVDAIRLHFQIASAFARTRPTYAGSRAAQDWRREGLDQVESLCYSLPKNGPDEFLDLLSELEQCLVETRPTDAEFRRFLEGSARDAIADLPEQPRTPHLFGAYSVSQDGPWSRFKDQPSLIAALYYKKNRTVRLLLRETRRAAESFGRAPFEPVSYQESLAAQFKIRLTGNQMGAYTVENYSRLLEGYLQSEAYQRMHHHRVLLRLSLHRYRLQIGGYPATLEEAGISAALTAEPLTGAQFTLRTNADGQPCLVTTPSSKALVPLYRLEPRHFRLP
ncbi:MAG: hypothetical protein AAF488_17050 [Planctomycetota bacterium]